MFSRADLVVPTTVTPLNGAGAPWLTFTRNVGAGGVRLEQAAMTWHRARLRLAA